MENFKSGFVTLIGRPNVGKSTLMNNIIGQKIAITSSKPQTTRNKIQTIYTSNEGQIIFLDTPGIHKAETKLGEYMGDIVKKALREVDVVLWLVEPTTYIGGGEQYIAELVKNIDVPVILVINKIDTLEKSKVLQVIDKYRRIANFSEIVPISAINGDNKEELLKTILDLLPEGPMYYDEDVITDQAERQIVAEFIREQSLRMLKEEVPHGIAVTIESMKEEKDTSVRHSHKNIMKIEATLFCEKNSHKGIIIGKQGAMLKEITKRAKRKISDLLDIKVTLNIWVKVKKDWRNSNSLMKDFGYKEEDI